MSTSVLPLPPRYRARRVLGAGGMGQVLVAWDEELGREVALKVMTQEPGERLRVRFAREGRILAGLRCPQVVEVYDLDAAAPRPWMAMELLEGEDLSMLLLDDPLATYLEVAGGLEVVHQAGIVHRDVKPANVLRTLDGRVVLIDFGLATGLSEDRITQTGALVGSFGYMAPEVLRGGDASPRSDWYSWGVCLYRALEGELPYDTDALMDRLAGEDLGPPEFRRVSKGTPERRLIRRCLASDPARRPRNLEEVEAILCKGDPAPAAPAAPAVTRVAPGRVSAPHPPAPPGSSRSGGLALAVVLAALALGAASLRDPGSPGPPSVGDLPDRASRPEVSDPVGVDLERELLEALDAPDRSFRDAYEVRGAGAYEDLPGQAAWLAWLRAGGVPEALPAEVRERLIRTDRTARAVGLVAPFGEGWFLEGGASAPSEWVSRARDATTNLKALTSELAEAIRVRPQDFPGADPAVNLLEGRARVLGIFDAAAPDPRLRRELDAVLAAHRAGWRTKLGAVVRALDAVPLEETPRLLGELGYPEMDRTAGFGSIVGADWLRVLGRSPRGFSARYYVLRMRDAAGKMALRHGFRRAVAAEAREVAWLELAEGPMPEGAPPSPELATWIDGRRKEAWVLALRRAWDRQDRGAVRRILPRIPPEIRASRDVEVRATVEKIAAWASGDGAASRPRSPGP